MRYPASEKAEIVELVERSHLPAKRTLDKLGIPRATFYRWYDRYRSGGPEALADRRSQPDRLWNRIPDDVRGQIIDLALDLPELSPRELAVRFFEAVDAARRSIATTPEATTPRRFLIAALWHAGAHEEAKQECSAMLAMQPNASLSRGRWLHVMRHCWMADLVIEGLRQSGVPE